MAKNSASKSNTIFFLQNIQLIEWKGLVLSLNDSRVLAELRVLREKVVWYLFIFLALIADQCFNLFVFLAGSFAYQPGGRLELYGKAGKSQIIYQDYLKNESTKENRDNILIDG